MIASLYRGGKFIRQFLENITSQSLFEQAELIIIDACSPDGEGEVIREYQRTFPNIVYRRINHRLGIYEAWNLAVEMARGRYLTNTNLDDLRRHDSIALQAAMLDAHDDVDVVYQDFYYSLEPFLSFEQAAAFGFKSELPTVTAHNLLQFNSPHNAPMWRASLHAELGGFDTRYRSAGDWEFWLRCIERGKIFRKINSPHVIYYQNPEGISTRPDTRGVEESNHILGRYSAQLISPVLLRSRRDFRAGLGLGDVGQTAPDNAPYYDVVQGALSRLGAGRSVLPAPSVRDPRGGEDGPIRLLIDGVFFQLARTGIARVWTSLLPRLARAPGLSVLMLDRGGAPDIPGVERIEFPSYTMSYTATDSMLIQEFCDKLAIDVFSSSYFTSALATAQVQMVYDMIPESLGFDVSHRVWKEKQLALSYASHFACISERTRDDLIRCYPGIEPWRIAIAYCGVDTETFNPDAARHLPAFRERHALRRPYFLLVGSREQHQNYKNGKLVFDAVKAGGAADFDLVCVGGERTINAAWLHGMPRGIAIRHLDLSDADLATAYAGAEALVYPSLYEGFGLPVIEAMASGCPVISTRLGSLGEVAGDAALSISGQDPLELRQAMERVRTPRARRGLIDAGLARAGQFRWDASAEMFVALARAARSHRRTHEADEFHRRWSRLRVAQAGVDIGLD
jgi:glycosyltransferase involved in cell wall biosynthesis